MSKKIVVVSGGFDPIHVGHLRMMKEAAEYGNLIVIINSDSWLKRKKEYVFMPWQERAEIISALSCVTGVIEAKDADDSVCETLKELKPDIFANGGDRIKLNTPESNLCEELGIELKWNVGGDKIRSSSRIIRDATNRKRILDHNRYRKETAY